MEITPATLAQVRRGASGKLVQIDADVAHVADDLRAIDPNLHLRYSEAGRYFVVYEVIENADGSFKENLVFTAQELDQRIVQRVRELLRPDYDFVEEAAKQDQAAQDAIDARFREQVSEAGERLFHAMRKDAGKL